MAMIGGIETLDAASFRACDDKVMRALSKEPSHLKVFYLFTTIFFANNDSLRLFLNRIMLYRFVKELSI